MSDIAAVLARGIAYFCWWVAGVGTMPTLIALALLIADSDSFNEGVDAGELILFWLLAAALLVAAGWPCAAWRTTGTRSTRGRIRASGALGGLWPTKLSTRSSGLWFGASTA